MKKEALTKELLVGAAADLNEVLKLKPQIEAEFSSSLKGVALKAAREKFEKQLGKDLIESAQLITGEDVLKQNTIDVLKALGVSEVKAQVSAAKESAAEGEKVETKKRGEKKSPGKEDAKVSGKKTKTPAKKSGVKKAGKKEVKADLDGYGFPKESKRSEAVKLMMTGKVSMVDLKKKFGVTFYGPLKKLESDGYGVKKDDKGHIVISPPEKK